ncbi:conserved Plasmodium protein, unknown function [Plasmodium sp. gorilla clade G2]|uniref:conserved Plasmodium protein, unknown function n=1 Tax=Plasmodium sp. gorilla clade G2 TaxID=880535 RepID=UPI000D223FC8|nr:conserved Plasmodium protein, unknown function [Plasmodium sp. gorilla clade G2]SOV19222.1 conserved Plasmodium protein, unknown function [Plasmodium sp. gorilla clade G2]
MSNIKKSIYFYKDWSDENESEFYSEENSGSVNENSKISSANLTNEECIEKEKSIENSVHLEYNNTCKNSGDSIFYDVKNSQENKHSSFENEKIKLSKKSFYSIYDDTDENEDSDYHILKNNRKENMLSFCNKKRMDIYEKEGFINETPLYNNDNMLYEHNNLNNINNQINNNFNNNNNIYSNNFMHIYDTEALYSDNTEKEKYDSDDSHKYTSSNNLTKKIKRNIIIKNVLKKINTLINSFKIYKSQINFSYIGIFTILKKYLYIIKNNKMIFLKKKRYTKKMHLCKNKDMKKKFCRVKTFYCLKRKFLYNVDIKFLIKEKHFLKYLYLCTLKKKIQAHYKKEKRKTEKVLNKLIKYIINNEIKKKAKNKINKSISYHDISDIKNGKYNMDRKIKTYIFKNKRSLLNYKFYHSNDYSVKKYLIDFFGNMNKSDDNKNSDETYVENTNICNNSFDKDITNICTMDKENICAFYEDKTDENGKNCVNDENDENYEEVKNDVNYEEVKNDVNYEEVKNDENDEEVKSNENDEEVKNDENYEEVKSDENDEEVKNDENYEEVKSDENYGDVKNDVNYEDVKNDENDEEVKNDENDEEVKNDVNDENATNDENKTYEKINNIEKEKTNELVHNDEIYTTYIKDETKLMNSQSFATSQDMDNSIKENNNYKNCYDIDNNTNSMDNLSVCKEHFNDMKREHDIHNDINNEDKNEDTYEDKYYNSISYIDESVQNISYDNEIKKSYSDEIISNHGNEIIPICGDQIIPNCGDQIIPSNNDENLSSDYDQKSLNYHSSKSYISDTEENIHYEENIKDTNNYSSEGCLSYDKNSSKYDNSESYINNNVEKSDDRCDEKGSIQYNTNSYDKSYSYYSDSVQNDINSYKSKCSDNNNNNNNMNYSKDSIGIIKSITSSNSEEKKEITYNKNTTYSYDYNDYNNNNVHSSYYLYDQDKVDEISQKNKITTKTGSFITNKSVYQYEKYKKDQPSTNVIIPSKIYNTNFNDIENKLEKEIRKSFEQFFNIPIQYNDFKKHEEIKHINDNEYMKQTKEEIKNFDNKDGINIINKSDYTLSMQNIMNINEEGNIPLNQNVKVESISNSFQSDENITSNNNINTNKEEIEDKTNKYNNNIYKNIKNNPNNDDQDVHLNEEDIIIEKHDDTTNMIRKQEQIYKIYSRLQNRILNDFKKGCLKKMKKIFNKKCKKIEKDISQNIQNVVQNYNLDDINCSEFVNIYKKKSKKKKKKKNVKSKKWADNVQLLKDEQSVKNIDDHENKLTDRFNETDKINNSDKNIMNNNTCYDKKCDIIDNYTYNVVQYDDDTYKIYNSSNMYPYYYVTKNEEDTYKNSYYYNVYNYENFNKPDKEHAKDKYGEKDLINYVYLNKGNVYTNVEKDEKNKNKECDHGNTEIKLNIYQRKESSDSNSKENIDMNNLECTSFYFTKNDLQNKNKLFDLLKNIDKKKNLRDVIFKIFTVINSKVFSGDMINEKRNFKNNEIMKYIKTKNVFNKITSYKNNRNGENKQKKMKKKLHGFFKRNKLNYNNNNNNISYNNNIGKNKNNIQKISKQKKINKIFYPTNIYKKMYQKIKEHNKNKEGNHTIIDTYNMKYKLINEPNKDIYFHKNENNNMGVKKTLPVYIYRMMMKQKNKYIPIKKFNYSYLFIEKKKKNYNSSTRNNKILPYYYFSDLNNMSQKMKQILYYKPIVTNKKSIYNEHIPNWEYNKNTYVTNNMINIHKNTNNNDMYYINTNVDGNSMFFDDNNTCMYYHSKDYISKEDINAKCLMDDCSEYYCSLDMAERTNDNFDNHKTMLNDNKQKYIIEKEDAHKVLLNEGTNIDVDLKEKINENKEESNTVCVDDNIKDTYIVNENNELVKMYNHNSNLQIIPSTGKKNINDKIFSYAIRQYYYNLNKCILCDKENSKKSYPSIYHNNNNNNTNMVAQNTHQYKGDRRNNFNIQDNKIIKFDGDNNYKYNTVNNYYINDDSLSKGIKKTTLKKNIITNNNITNNRNNSNINYSCNSVIQVKNNIINVEAQKQKQNDNKEIYNFSITNENVIPSYYTNLVNKYKKDIGKCILKNIYNGNEYIKNSNIKYTCMNNTYMNKIYSKKKNIYTNKTYMMQNKNINQVYQNEYDKPNVTKYQLKVKKITFNSKNQNKQINNTNFNNLDLYNNKNYDYFYYNKNYDLKNSIKLKNNNIESFQICSINSPINDKVTNTNYKHNVENICIFKDF